MFCPNCGQQSAYETSRYCRQCGFRLDGAAQLLAQGGAPLMLAPPVVPATDAPRRKGMKLGVKLVLASLVLFPFCLWFAVEAVDSPFPLLMPLTIFLAGIARIVYARLFEEAARPALPVTYTALPMPPRFEPVLPAARPMPVGAPAQAPHIKDPYQPPGVTEQTTGLLNRQKPV